MTLESAVQHLPEARARVGSETSVAGLDTAGCAESLTPGCGACTASFSGCSCAERDRDEGCIV